jgi:hypothetical protein
MAKVAALSYANDVLVDRDALASYEPDRRHTPSKIKGRYNKTHGHRKLRPPKPPDKGGTDPPAFAPEDVLVPFCSTAPPIIAFGDAGFTSSMRGSAPSPGGKVSFLRHLVAPR